jgi:hypothetical protein
MPTNRRRRFDRPNTADEPLLVADDTVRDRAYELYEERGSEPGHEWDDWLKAERELRPLADE